MRCPNGYTQDPPKSGKCVKKSTTQTKKKRCQKGTRKNKQGQCVTSVKMQKIDKKKEVVATSKSKKNVFSLFRKIL